MGKRPTRLRDADVLAVMRHMADVAARKAEPVAQRQYLIDGLNQLVGTDSSFLYVAEEWRPDMRPHFVHHTLTTVVDPAFLQYASEFGVAIPLDEDPFCYRSIRSGAGEQTWMAGDVLPDLATRRRHANFMVLKTAARLADGMISFYRSGPGGSRIVGVGMHRFGAAPRLTSAQSALATFAVGEIRRLVERGHLSLPPPEPLAGLPPRLKQVMDRMLAGQAPKRIARELGGEHVDRARAHPEAVQAPRREQPRGTDGEVCQDIRGGRVATCHIVNGGTKFPAGEAWRGIRF